MNIFDIKLLRKEVEKEYFDKGYSEEQIECALVNDPRYPKDRLIKVTGYDLENNKILGLFGDDKCEVTITAVSTEPKKTLSEKISSNQSQSLFSGEKIDEHMEKSIPVESQLIVEQSVIQPNSHILSIIGTRIIRVAPASENKNFYEGLFSKSSFGKS